MLNLSCYQQLLVHVARSSELSRALRQVQHAAGLKAYEIILWNDTRWLGEYYALERFLKLAPFLQQVCTDLATTNQNIEPILSSTTIDMMEHYRKILEPAQKLSLQMQEDSKPTISILLHWISDMINFWKPVALDPQPAARFRADLLISLKQRFKYLFEEVNLALLAAALDPRYGNLPWISADLRDTVWKQLNVELQLVQVPQQDAGSTTHSITSETDFGLAQSALLRLREHFEKESVQYVECNQDPLVWWRQQSAKRDASGIIALVVAPLAQTLLAVPCSIASAERVFSGYTNVLEGRERLGADRVEQLLQIKHFIKQPDYNFNDLNIAIEKQTSGDKEENTS